MLKNDAWIREAASTGMIHPFSPELVRAVLPDPNEVLMGAKPRRVLSFGTSSYGYDIRLSPKEFFTFRHIPGTVLNPKEFTYRNLEPATLHQDTFGQYFILPGHSYGLGVALEHLDIPPYITVICIGKSTYARCGIIANLTPAEAGWRGHLTLEFSNSSPSDCRIYTDEGICQLLFLEGDRCLTSYEERSGKYQDQPQSVTVARI